jgi:hypothetical protein
LAAYNQVMLVLMCLLTLVQTDPNDRAKELIEKFRSEDVKVRDAATAELTKLGEPIRKTLEAAAKDKDPEVASRVRDVIKALDRAAIKHPWASFKPGSYSKMRIVSDMTVAGNAMKTEMSVTYTLLQSTAEECVVETEFVMANVPSQKNQIKIALGVPQAAPVEPPQQKKGTEELTVGGKKLTCKWVEMDSTAAGMTTTVKIWTHESVPGYTVKTLTKNPNLTSVMEVVEFSSK